MYMMGTNEYFMGDNESKTPTKTGSTALDLAVAIPAGIVNLTQAYAALKQKPQKVVIQQAPQQEQLPERESGLSTWEWVAIGVGAIAVIGAGAYFISQRRKA